MRRLLPHPLLTLVLMLVWLLLVNSAAPGSILLGLGLGEQLSGVVHHLVVNLTQHAMMVAGRSRPMRVMSAVTHAK